VKRGGGLWRRDARDVRAELEEEIRFHMERRAAELERAGYGVSEAEQEARRRFGDVRQTLEVCMESDLKRERRTVRRELIADAVQDARLGVRQLRRRPGFAVLAVVTLGGAIGAAAAIYAVADHVLVRPLPYDAPERIVTLWEVAQEGDRSEVSPANYIDWKERARSFSALGLAEPWSADLTGAGAPVALQAWRVTDGFLEALGVRPVMGRLFTSAEYQVGEGIGLLSYRAWQQRFGGERSVVGRVLTLDGAGVEIVGVLPPSLEYPEPEELWLPKSFRPDELTDRRSAYMRVVARLAGGVTVQQAQAEMDALAARMAGEHVANRGRGAAVIPLDDEVRGGARPVVRALALATALLLLIACANVANLLVSRGLERSSELAVRGALGAGRLRLARQLMSEALVLSVCAGAVGIVFAYWGIQALTALAPADLPRLSAVALDTRVLTFLVLLTLFTAVLFGSLPALQLSRPDLMSILRAGSARASSERVRRWLVTAEIAFCFVLLIGAGLLTRSLVLLTNNELGFETRGRAAVQTFLWDNNPVPEQRIDRVREMLVRMEALPGVHAAAAVSALPFHPHAITATGGLLIEGAPPEPDDTGRRVFTTVVTPRYFDVMGIPLVRGRPFSDADGTDTTPVVIINESIARTYFPGIDPIGRRIRGGVMGPPVTRQIVGVAGDVRASAFDSEPAPELYVPHTQSGTGSMTFVAHAAIPTSALIAGMRTAVWGVDPVQTIYHEATLAALVSSTLAQRTFQLTLTAAFGAMALLLVVLGVYGVVSLWARERRRELGVRVALGARAHNIVTLVLRQGLAVALPGLLIGAAAATLAARLLEHTLHGVHPTDTLTFSFVAVLLLAAAAAASFLPACAAIRHDPSRSLRPD
jgi:predicted permease